MTEQVKQKKKSGFFKKLLNKYDAFCKELGVDNGACRSCTPIVREDEEGNLAKDKFKGEM